MSRPRMLVLFGVTMGVLLTQTYNNLVSERPALRGGPVESSLDSFVTSGRRLEIDEPGIAPLQIVSNEKETFHVLFGLMGSTTSLFDAWEVSLKSVLVNAPIDADMHVHIMCSQDACDTIEKKIKEAGLEGSRWRNQITISTYNVEMYNQEWREFLRDKLRHNRIDNRVTLGGYYRLLAYKILAPLKIGPTIYMDTDVIILANLNDLIKNMDDTKVFQGSKKSFCSGFTVINMKKFHEFWEKVDLLEKVPIGDQDIMNEVLKQFPEIYGELPIEWDRNLGNGYRRRPQKILIHKEAAGMLHYQGGSGQERKNGQNYFHYGLDYFCDRSPVCRENDKFRRMVASSWGLGDFYTRLTWKWAKYFGKSAIALGKDGFVLQQNTCVGSCTKDTIE